MKQKSFFLAAILLFSSMAVGAQKPGGLSANLLKKIQQAQPSSPADKAIINAVASNNIDDLVKNRANQGAVDTYFNVETPKQSIHDQQKGGHCRIFSGFNVLRANFARRHQDTLTVEFSRAYLFLYDQLEKASLMLQGAIDNASKSLNDKRIQFFFKNPVNDGGTFCGVADLAEKYGLVPMSVMPETYSSDNTRVMAHLLSSKLREYGLKLQRMVSAKKKKAEVEKRKTGMLVTVYRILSLTIDESAQNFTYTFKNKDGKTVTPRKHYTPRGPHNETVGHEPDETFIMVMSGPRRAYHETYEVKYDRRNYDGHNWKHLDLPMGKITQLAIASLKDRHKMCSSYDIDKQLDRKRGYMDVDSYDYGNLLRTTSNMGKVDRITTFDSDSTHTVTLAAVDLNAQGKPLKWKVENSQGAANGQKGCFIMTNQWFNGYMFRLVINRKYVLVRLLEGYNKTSTMVMPEDPLFGCDE